MSEGNPVYSGNAFEQFIEHVGHDVHVVFDAGEKLVANLPKYIKAAQDVHEDVAPIIPLVQAVIAASLALAQPVIAIGSAISTAGTNLAADEAALASVISAGPALQAKIVAFVAAVKALASQIGVDWSQLIADLSPAAAAPVAS